MSIHLNIKHTLFVSAACLSISACGGGGSSSNVEANVTQECTNLVGFTVFNRCDFIVNARSINSNGVAVTANGANTNETLQVLLQGESLENTQLVICRAPSIPNNAATGCN